MSFRHLIKLARHPRTFIDSILTYPRFLGVIKPDLLPRRIEDEFKARLACYNAGWWPAELRSPIGRRILALSAHPDDETIGAGGLLIAHREQADISVITIFNGDGGGRLEDTETSAADYKRRLAETRLEELRRACQHFSGKIIGGLGFSDGTDPASIPDAAERLRALVEIVNPDVVILPWFLDQHLDHRNANLLWASACADIPCMVLGTELWSLLTPNAYFDTTDFLTAKIAAVGEFKTQLATVDYKFSTEALAKVRAFYWGVHERRIGAAEAFISMPNNDYCELVLSLRAP
jgi:LmbE family N-acetylglucosaminyl deacetylase